LIVTDDAPSTWPRPRSGAGDLEPARLRARAGQARRSVRL